MQFSSVRCSVFLAFEELAERLRQRLLTTIAKLRFVIIEKHRALQEALCERENRLLKLLATSFDAIVVIDGEHSILDANQRALTLLGISRTNIDKFTIDAFLPDDRVSHFIRSGPLYLRGRERGGECQIKRLDGGWRDTEFAFQANFIPGRHLCRFRDVAFDKTRVETRADGQMAKIPSPMWDSDANPRTNRPELAHLSICHEKFNTEKNY
jgi:PAS domain S-box-containing protein